MHFICIWNVDGDQDEGGCGKLSSYLYLFFWLVTMTRLRVGVGSDGDLGRKNPTEDFPDVVKVAATEDEDHDRHYCEQEKFYVVQS